MIKEKYIKPVITTRVVVTPCLLLEGSPDAEGSDITDVDTSDDPYSTKGEAGFENGSFSIDDWD